MTKRIIASILVCVIILGTVFSFEGCGKKESTITKGEVLALIEEAFGMSTYSSSVPYTNTVKEDSSYFSTVQIAFEWELIDDKNIKVNDKVTKGFLANVLVKCVGFEDVSEMSNDEILEFAVKNKYVSFSYRGRTDSKRNVTRDEATDSIASSIIIWLAKSPQQKEEVDFGNNVINLAEGKLSSKDVTIDESSNVIELPASMKDMISEGKDFVLPPMNGETTAQVYHADQVEIQGDSLVIKTSAPEIETTIENMDVSGCVVPNLSQVPIMDGAGNRIISANATGMQSVAFLDYPENYGYEFFNGGGKVPSVLKKTSLSFEAGGLKVKGTVKDNSVEFSISGEIANDGNTKLSVSKSYEIKDISLDYDYKISWFQLKYAYAKLNYTVIDKTGLKLEGVKASYDIDRTNAKTALTSLARAVSKEPNKLSKTIKICSIPIISGGVVSFNLDVKVIISASGSIELAVTTNNVRGVEYKNGNLRFIKEQKEHYTVDVKGKIEATLYIGASFKALGFNIVSVGLEGGIGVAGSISTFMVDNENRMLEKVSYSDVSIEGFDAGISGLSGLSYEHNEYGNVPVRFDSCMEFKFYWILKFKVDHDCLIGKCLKGKIKLEVVFFDKDNATFLTIHVEDGHIVKECTRKYANDKDEEKEDDEEKENQAGGDYLDINTYFTNISVGEVEILTVEKLPDGYSMKDIEFASSNNSIARVDGNGCITGLSGGQVEIKVQTKDKKYSISCSVFVIEPTKSIAPTGEAGGGGGGRGH